MQIRTRLTLQFLLLGGIILIFASAAIFLSARSYLRKDFYELLKERARTITYLVLDSYELNANRALRTGALQDEKIIILNMNNDTLYISDETWNLRIMNGLTGYVKTDKEVFTNQDQYFVIGIPYSSGINRFTVIAAAVNRDGPPRLRKLAVLLAIVCLTGLVLFTITGWMYAGRALKPISDMVRRVDDITITSLHLRVPEGNGTDEIGRLAKTFNKMLERLEEAVNMQKNFIANASHELRTPLTSINGQLEVLLMKDRSTDEYRSELSSVMEDIRSMIDLSNRLLLIAGLNAEVSSGYSKKVRIDEVLWQAQEDMKKFNPEYRINISLDSSFTDSDQMIVSGDDYLIKVAFSNIIDNACKYSPDKKVAITCGRKKEWVRVLFEDKGIGIAEEDRQKIFEPFYRGVNTISKSGSGVGLSLVNQIIKNHSGKINITSRVGQGTLVEILLPAMS